METGELYEALKTFDHRWVLEALASLADEPKRYNEWQRSVGIWHSTTFQRVVQHLLDHGLVRHPNEGDGSHYTLTPKGEHALPALVAFVRTLQEWDDACGGGDRSSKR